MRLRTVVTLSILATAGFLALLLATHEWSLGTLPDGAPRYRYLLEDEADRFVYQQRGRWLPSGRLPYIEEHSEYPQLATWMFGLPYLAFEHHVPAGRAQTNAELRRETGDSRAYFDLHHVSMAVGYLALLIGTALALAALGRPPAYALLLLLPGTLYFSFNRFDAWPAAAVALALLAQFRGRPALAAVLLALGGMIKWYPLLLMPLFLAHNLWSVLPPGPGLVRRLLAALPRRVIGPGLACTAVVAAILAVTYFQGGGGLEAVTKVYGHHAGRVHNPPSLVSALVEPDRYAVFPLESADRVAGVFAWLQFLPALLLALLPVRRRESLLLGCLVVVLAFAQFGKVFSPQWICWVSPLALLLAPARLPALVFTLVLELLIYVQIPVLYYEAWGRLGDLSPEATAFWAVSDTRIVLLALFWAWSLVAFARTVGRHSALPT